MGHDHCCKCNDHGPSDRDNFKQLVEELQNFGRMPKRNPTDDRENKLYWRLQNFKSKQATREQNDELDRLFHSHAHLSVLKAEVTQLGHYPRGEHVEEQSLLQCPLHFRTGVAEDMVAACDQIRPEFFAE